MATGAQRPGHVGRDRIFGAGSVLERQLHEQRETQQQAARAEAAAAAPNSDVAAQVTWPELWDARTTAGFVGVALEQEHSRHKSMQLRWRGHAAAGSTQRQRQHKRKHAQLLQYSAVMARALQRSATATAPAPGQHALGQTAAAVQPPVAGPVTLPITQPSQLFGPPRAKRQRTEQQLQECQGGSAGPCAGETRAAAADDLQLLEQYGCLPGAHGVYTHLLTWLQQQQHSPSGPDTETHPGFMRLQSAAAAAAALAPGLLAGVLQQQGHLPVVNLAPGSVLAWVSDCFDAAASAAVQAHKCASSPQQQQQSKQQQQQGASHPQGELCTGLRQPLPLHTLLAVCDRRGASLRQGLSDVAAAAVAACGGRLPVITRSYSHEGGQVLRQLVLPQEWLWTHWAADRSCTKVLPVHDQGRTPPPADMPAVSGSDEGDELHVIENIESQDWDEVVYVRGRVRQLLSAWHTTLLQQTGAGGQQQQQQQLAAEPHAVDKQLRRLLGLQVLQVTQGWGSAQPCRLRQGLRTAPPPPLPPPQQQMRNRAAVGSNRLQQEGWQHQQGQQWQEHQQLGSVLADPGGPGPAGVRRSARLSGRLQLQHESAQVAEPARTRDDSSRDTSSSSNSDSSQPSKSAERHSSSSSSKDSDGSEDESVPDGDSGGHSGPASGSPAVHTTHNNGGSGPLNATAGLQQGEDLQGQAHQRQDLHVGCGDADTDDDYVAVLRTWLDSLDDLLLPPAPSAADEHHSSRAAAPSCACSQHATVPAWQPGGSSQWRRIKAGSVDGDRGCFTAGPRPAASGRIGSRHGAATHDPQGVQALGQSSSWVQLPAEVRDVLAAASSTGVSPQVLQRAAARLLQLVGKSVPSCTPT